MGPTDLLREPPVEPCTLVLCETCDKEYSPGEMSYRYWEKKKQEWRGICCYCSRQMNLSRHKCGPDVNESGVCEKCGTVQHGSELDKLPLIRGYFIEAT